MKRINRKKLIGELEEFRQGFADACMCAARRGNSLELKCFQSYHKGVNKVIVELGGESVESVDYSDLM